METVHNNRELQSTEKTKRKKKTGNHIQIIFLLVHLKQKIMIL